MKKKFRGLRIISAIYRFLGVFLAGVSIVGGIVVVIAEGDFQSLPFVIPSAFAGLVLYGFGELIMLLLDLEESARIAAYSLERLAERRKQRE